MSSGIRVSQAGIPVNAAADYQKMMDERWPLLEFNFMDVIDRTLSSNEPGTQENPTGTIAYVPIYEHNLGFLPGFRVIDIASTGFSASNARLDAFVFADEKYIYVQLIKSAGVVSFHIKCWLAICPRNLNETFSAPVETAVAGMTSSPSKYGVKIAKQGGIDSLSKDNFTLHTNAKSMNIQMHGLVTADSADLFKLKIDHNLSYPPTYYIASRTVPTGVDPLAGRTIIKPMATIVGLASNTANRLTIRGVQAAFSGTYMFVILKDPVDTAS